MTWLGLHKLEIASETMRGLCRKCAAKGNGCVEQEKGVALDTHILQEHGGWLFVCLVGSSLHMISLQDWHGDVCAQLGDSASRRLSGRMTSRTARRSDSDALQNAVRGLCGQKGWE